MAVKQLVFDRKTLNLISEKVIESDFKPDRKKLVELLAANIIQNKGAELYEYITTQNNVGEKDRKSI